MTTRVLAAVITDGARFLLAERPAHKRHGGLWEFPGGKVEPGESDLEAVRRELREELDVQVTRVGEVLLSVQDPGSEFVIDFVRVDITGTARCIEHTELRWESPEEIVALPLAPSDLRFARALVAGAESGRAVE